MSTRFCPECGYENPAEARYCMNCGGPMSGMAGQIQVAPPAPAPAPAPAPQSKSIDPTTIIAGILAFFGLRHMTRKARETSCLVIFLVLFFGCPMACGFVAFVMEWFASFFR